MRKASLLLLVVPLALAACGSSSNAQVKVDPVAYVKHAATKTADLTSEHMTMSGTINAAGQSISLRGNGDFANDPVKGSFALSMSGMGQNFALKEVFAGNAVYVNAPGLTSHLAPGKTWTKVDLSKLSNATHLSLISQNPTQFLGQLEGAGSVKSLGTETIDGVETTHYQVSNVDLSKIPQAARLEALAHAAVGPIDVWIGNSDGYVYRESVSVSATSGGQRGSFLFKTDFSKFNEPVTITVPPASETLDMSKRLGGHG